MNKLPIQLTIETAEPNYVMTYLMYHYCTY